MFTARTRTAARFALALSCGLALCCSPACAGPQRPRCPPGEPEAGALKAFPHHALLASHLEALASLIDDPESEPFDIASAVDEYIQGLPHGARTLGRSTQSIESRLEPRDFEAFCAGSGRRIMAARQRLDEALAALSERDDVSAAYVANAVRIWLERSTF
jgi:hypothetical protein